MIRRLKWIREICKDCSGQVLILTAMAIAFIIISTIVYVYTVSQHPSPVDNSYEIAAFIRNIKLGTRNLMIGSLANISYGGNVSILETNLQRWCEFVESHYYLGRCDLRFELCEDDPYSSGTWISWGTQGLGVTSAKADFSLNLTSKSVEATVNYPINITTSLIVNGIYRRYSLFRDVVNVTISLFNEDHPALAKNLTVYYSNMIGWREASALNTYELKDFGNGTYTASFIILGTWTHRIRVACYDQREIYVQATTTCVRT